MRASLTLAQDQLSYICENHGDAQQEHTVAQRRPDGLASIFGTYTSTPTLVCSRRINHNGKVWLPIQTSAKSCTNHAKADTTFWIPSEATKMRRDATWLCVAAYAHWRGLPQCTASEFLPPSSIRIPRVTHPYSTMALEIRRRAIVCPIRCALPV